jgi:hypothetical protein
MDEIDLVEEDVVLAYKLVEFSILSQSAIYNMPETLSMLIPIPPPVCDLALFPSLPSLPFLPSLPLPLPIPTPLPLPLPVLDVSLQPISEVQIQGRKPSFADFHWYKREYHEFAVKIEMSKARNCLSEKNKLKIEGMKKRLIEMSTYSILRSVGKEKTLWKKEHEDLIDLIKLFDS